MVISRKAEIPRVSITVKNNLLEQVKEFTYLGQNLYMQMERIVEKLGEE